MHQKREMRKNKKMNEDTKSLPSTSINWFPGHMAKTRRQITEDLKMIDVVIEILDARIPIASQNPDIRQITQNKKKVIVLNKCDLADEKDNQKWREYFIKKGCKAVLVDSNNGLGINEVIKQVQEVMIDEILKYNKEFVEEKKYEQYKTSKYPDKKIAIITCMDTRLTELLPAALGIRNGDVKIIKNAGGVVSHAFGSVVRSVLVGIFELGIEEVMVIGHSDCGVQHINSDMMIEHMMDRGVDEEKIELIRHCGIDFDTWLEGFDCVESSVKDSVEMLRKHPLIPKDVKISGYVMDSVTGELHVVEP